MLDDGGRRLTRQKLNQADSLAKILLVCLHNSRQCCECERDMEQVSACLSARLSLATLHLPPVKGLVVGCEAGDRDSSVCNCLKLTQIEIQAQIRGGECEIAVGKLHCTSR